MKKTVGIAAGRKYENYLKWILQGTDIEVIKLSNQDKNFDAVKQCDGIVLTGGEDVHPRFYHQPKFVDQYKLDDLDEARDEFELKIVLHCQRKEIPLLGICRGMQVANVFFGGTLIPDIPTFGKPEHRKHEEGKDRYHPLWLVENTFLQEISGTKKGEVNSAHHQSVDLLGDGLAMNAVSPDGIVEGAELKDREGHPFLLLVQWHPERMIDQQNPFSKNIRDRFIDSLSK